MTKKNRPGKGTGLAHTVADHGRRITKVEHEVKEQAADIADLADAVLDTDQLPDTASGIRRARRRRTKKRL